MGVTWVLHCAPEAGKQPLPSLGQELERKLESLGAKRLGPYSTDAVKFSPIQPSASLPRQDVYSCHHTDSPHSSFSVAVGGGGPSYLVSDTQFDQILAKMSAVYAARSNLSMECKGFAFALKDFVIRVGSVVIANQYKGCLVEIEYRPCVIPAMCTEIMREIAQLFLASGNFSGIQLPPPYMNRMKPNQAFQQVDTVLQYLEHFLSMQKTSQS